MVKGDIETAMMVNNNNSSIAMTDQQSIGCQSYRTGQQQQPNTTVVTGTNANSSTANNTNGTVTATDFPDVSAECPLCMETLDIDDLDFFPCSCGYQVCRFCWHRLKNDDNGLCPACRQVCNKQNLKTIRVVQKNLLFVIGIPPRFTQEELRKEFSKYGKIVKMVINSSSAYVTYTRPEDAVAAIQTLNDSSQPYQSQQQNLIQMNKAPKNQLMTNGGISTFGGSILTAVKASLGTTKYCTHWLRSQSCMYLHEMAEQEASFTKEEMQAGKHTEYEKRLIQHYLDIIAAEREKEKQLLQQQTIQTNGSKQTQQQRPYINTTTGNSVSNSPPIQQQQQNPFRKTSNERGQNSNGDISIDNDNSDQM
ncbi:hypothetical protein BLA29_005231, partial [Euroglyphus maynei]